MVDILDPKKNYKTDWFLCIKCNGSWHHKYDEVWEYCLPRNFPQNYHFSGEFIHRILCPFHKYDEKYWFIPQFNQYFYGCIDDDGGVVSLQIIEGYIVYVRMRVEELIFIEGIKEITEKEFINIAKQYHIQRTISLSKIGVENICRDFQIPKQFFDEISSQIQMLYSNTKIIGTDLIY